MVTVLMSPHPPNLRLRLRRLLRAFPFLGAGLIKKPQAGLPLTSGPGLQQASHPLQGPTQANGNLVPTISSRPAGDPSVSTPLHQQVPPWTRSLRPEFLHRSLPSSLRQCTRFLRRLSFPLLGLRAQRRRVVDTLAKLPRRRRTGLEPLKLKRLLPRQQRRILMPLLRSTLQTVNTRCRQIGVFSAQLSEVYFSVVPSCCSEPTSMMISIIICIIITIRCKIHGVDDFLPTFDLPRSLHNGVYDYWKLSC